MFCPVVTQHALNSHQLRWSDTLAVTDLSAFGEEHAEFAFYNSSKATALSTLLAQGEACAAELKLTSDDVVCLPVYVSILLMA